MTSAAAKTRLRSHADFVAVYTSKQAVRNRNLTACFLASENEVTRLGLSVSRRIGNAVRRNRVKRVLRAAFRQEGHALDVPLDLILIPRSYETAQDFNEMVSSLSHLIRKLNRRLSEDS